jgi:hypothetical protein
MASGGGGGGTDRQREGETEQRTKPPVVQGSKRGEHGTDGHDRQGEHIHHQDFHALQDFVEETELEERGDSSEPDGKVNTGFPRRRSTGAYHTNDIPISNGVRPSP